MHRIPIVSNTVLLLQENTIQCTHTSTYKVLALERKLIPTILCFLKVSLLAQEIPVALRLGTFFRAGIVSYSGCREHGEGGAWTTGGPSCGDRHNRGAL